MISPAPLPCHKQLIILTFSFVHSYSNESIKAAYIKDLSRPGSGWQNKKGTLYRDIYGFKAILQKVSKKIGN